MIMPMVTGGFHPIWSAVPVGPFIKGRALGEGEKPMYCDDVNGAAARQGESEREAVAAVMGIKLSRPGYAFMDQKHNMT